MDISFKNILFEKHPVLFEYTTNLFFVMICKILTEIFLTSGIPGSQDKSQLI